MRMGLLPIGDPMQMRLHASVFRDGLLPSAAIMQRLLYHISWPSGSAPLSRPHAQLTLAQGQLLVWDNASLQAPCRE